MKTPSIHLGFEVGSGNPSSVPLGHLCVFGQTQLAGKTTALEAMISRSDARAVAFVTKRGEGGFSGGRAILPYLQERADWQSVQEILESALAGKQDFKQPWIMRACEAANDLSDVQTNTKRLLKSAKRGMEQDMYYVLDHYFDLVIPQIRDLPKCDRIDLADGLNVMDLEGYTPELQAQVIRSTIEWIHRKETGVITVIPEAWRFLPQGRRSPVRMAAENLIREGGGLKNFMWLDSQDIAGIDKLPLRAARTWLIGVQRENNEVQRNLANIPDSFEKPKAKDVATLGIGTFFNCSEKSIVKTYVQPAWMDETTAKAISRGEMALDDLPPRGESKPIEIVSAPVAVRTAKRESQPILEKPMPKESELSSLKGILEQLKDQIAGLESPAPSKEKSSALPTLPDDEEAMFQRFRARIMSDPKVLSVLTTQPELRIEVTTETITMDGKSLNGRIARLLHNGYMKTATKHAEIYKELNRTGPEVNSGNLSRAMKLFVKLGFVTDEADGFREVPGMKKRIVEKE